MSDRKISNDYGCMRKASPRSPINPTVTHAPRVVADTWLASGIEPVAVNYNALEETTYLHVVFPLPTVLLENWP